MPVHAYALIWFLNFICVFLAVLGLRCCTGFSLVVRVGRRPLVVVLGPLTAMASCLEHGLQGTRASVVGARGPSRRDAQAPLLRACGILPDQGSNPCLLHWQVDFFLTTEQLGKPFA